MRFNIRAFLPASAVALILSFASSADACSCARMSPCQAYGAASVVFTGLVTQTGTTSTQPRLPSNAMSTTLTRGSSASLFKVEEAFLGVGAAEIEVSGESTTCDYYFKQGERYLVYAYKNPNGVTFHTNICSGTAPLSEAGDDLVYLRGVGKLPPGGGLFGEVSREPQGADKSGREDEPMSKVEVILESVGQRFRAVSDAGGKFELLGVPRGRYKVRTNPPTNFSSADVLAEEPRSEWEVEIPGQGCVREWFVARPNGEISGMVVDDTGVVAEDVEPQLIPADEKTARANLRTVRLDESRAFKFSFLPPGRYYLGFNLRSGPSVVGPYPEFYYPGVEERARAAVITLSEGQKISGLYLPRPLRLAERIIEGVAVWPDGRPFVSNCGITLTNPRTGYREGNCMSTDSQGRFKIKGIEGQTYELSATITVGKAIGLVNSQPVTVRVGKENRPVRLVVRPPRS